MRMLLREIKWMKWDKLCIRIDAGGRGFRNLHLFNVALLGKKMWWRLTTEPDALVCRILKAKYFPRKNFLDASIGRNPSFIWTSIHAGQGLLRKGVRWKVGKGNSIRVWRSPWLNDNNNFHIQTPLVEDLEDMVVSDIFIPGSPFGIRS